MSAKKLVQLDPSTQIFAAARFVKPHWSDSINGGLVDLDFLLRACLPDLTIQEWVPILATYRDFPADPSLLGTASLSIASAVMDEHGAISPDELPPQQQVPWQRIAQLTKAEQLAVLDVVRRYRVAERKNQLAGDTLAEQLNHLTHGPL